MPIMKDDGAQTGGSGGVSSATAGYSFFGSGNPENDLSAAVLVLLDEINALRTNPAIGLAAKTVADFKTAFNTKKV